MAFWNIFAKWSNHYLHSSKEGILASQHYCRWQRGDDRKHSFLAKISLSLVKYINLKQSLKMVLLFEIQFDIADKVPEF
ncbi:unnamed protein product [Clavelina lepadiformis]|uniref:Uncharacterized protein n=1 Tax=Clavelina lepadiformis TaxID=159417 RepID=A0ABP0F1H9_CLALP